MLWHERKWTELVRIDKSTPVVIPLGSCEQHGHHLPLFVDTIQVAEIAAQAEKKLGDGVLLLPALWLGSSEHHRDFCGTLSLEPSLYSRVIQSIARGVIDAGFTRIVFLNGHGGNRVPVAQALTELVSQSDRADAAHLLLATWWELNPASTNAQTLGMASPRLMHACEYETSVMLAIRPDLVSLQHAADSKPVLQNQWVDTQNDDACRVKVFKRMHRLTAAGSIGLPSAANPATGRKILDAVTQDLVNLLRDIRGWPDLDVIGPKQA